MDYFEVLFENKSLLKTNVLQSYYKSVKRLNSFFEKIHDKFQSIRYFDNPELKLQFKSISKRLNNIEITCFKYLMKGAPVEKIPEYLKNGLAKLSKEFITQKLT